MSSRNTFVTSYIYDDKAMDAVEVVLRKYTDYIHRENHFFAGVFKTGFLTVPDVELDKILKECDEALTRADYKLWFNIAVIGDDEDVVIHRADTFGEYRMKGESNANNWPGNRLQSRGVAALAGLHHPH